MQFKSKWINENDLCECKNYSTWKKDYSWNSSTCICEDGKYLKSVVGDSQTVCGQIIYVMDIVSKNVANAISKNVSTNSDGKKLNKKLIV